MGTDDANRTEGRIGAVMCSEEVDQERTPGPAGVRARWVMFSRKYYPVCRLVAELKVGWQAYGPTEEPRNDVSSGSLGELASGQRRRGRPEGGVAEQKRRSLESNPGSVIRKKRR